VADLVLCIVCPAYRATPREVSFPQVCDADRDRLAEDLAAVPGLAALAPGRVELERGTPGAAVSGSKDPPAPVNLAALGITAPAYRRGVRARWLTGPATDQIGLRPPIVTLDQWAADWWATRASGDPVPPPDLAEIVNWLSERLGWACDNHPAIDEFARDVKAMVRALRGIVRQQDPRGEPAGRCPARLRDDTRCGTPLYVDPYIDHIACTRCGRQWHRPSGGWVKLRAEQQQWHAGSEEAA